ncbi:MAG: hypothetical protein A3I77_04695 [Gammaproteobacteria bacterium RIFCSPLOWO2_02_FULL_42_14]|nr:MAG: hypothetical protein A3B71_05995 [Gammaproteobacteria bacterium RIFCSPHIGHO2_02_FULL_42_43]OGT28962.1 MAG: hypothetical protein A2624_02940 [Gammaproteobacteria bacterium RIFCSPHIGHO2_01_FULL_42_8]OGT51537.1 MAG: hypothetical protein A3E54_05760 [Gammaproteobacteria bacterium RIFCSPHIGHO2_12_FULL_41_25]OGT62237.1 MAG: hypothetical protein A3I77_04695 [Gammaproteobacteria bacterium RIFCSPLOWO2_02_FULL_42_14]
MQRFGYHHADLEGVCFGITCIALIAVLGNRILWFSHLMQTLSRSKLKMITREEKKCLDAIEMLQNPWQFSKIFNPREKNISYRTIPQDVNQIAHIKLPHPFKKNNKIVCIGKDFKKFTVTELTQHLKIMREKADRFPNKFVFLFFDIQHVILISYDHRTKRWMHIDANHLPIRFYKNDEDTAISIFSAFHCHLSLPKEFLIATHTTKRNTLFALCNHFKKKNSETAEFINESYRAYANSRLDGNFHQ